MSKVQTSVSEGFAVGIVGAIANSKPKYQQSMVAEEIMKTGIFVKLGTKPAEQIKKISATGDVALGKLWGVTVHDRTRPTPNVELDNSGGEGVRDFTIGEDVGVLKEGSIYMSPEDAMTPASAIYIRHAGRKQVQTLTWSGVLVSLNVINGKVGGIAIAPVTFTTDHATTMQLICDAILLANSDVLTCTFTGNIITMTTKLDAGDEDLSDWVVTLGAGQVTATIAETATSVHTDNIGRIRSDSDSSTATVAPTGTVRVLDKISADGIGAVSINLN